MVLPFFVLVIHYLDCWIPNFKTGIFVLENRGKTV